MEQLEGNRHVVIIITEAEWKRFTQLLEAFDEKLEKLAAPLRDTRAGPILPGYMTAMEPNKCKIFQDFFCRLAYERVAKRSRYHDYPNPYLILSP